MTVVAAAFLGPAGSYSHQAAIALLPATTQLVPHPSIAAAHAAGDAAAVVLPLENTIHGVVQETLACLLSDDADRWTIARTYDKQVQHCLVVPRACTDDELSDVKWVASHEQALGQCARFIRTHLPNAQLVPFPSTAQAARALAATIAGGKQQNDDDGGDIALLPPGLRASLGAAICSDVAVQGLPALRVARKGVQDVAANYTRFLLLQRRPPAAPTPQPTPLPLPRTGTTRFFRLETAKLLPSLLAHPHVRGLIAVHSRPNPHTGRINADTHAMDGVLQRDAPDARLQRLYDDKYRKRYLVEVEVEESHGQGQGQEGWPSGVIPL